MAMAVSQSSTAPCHGRHRALSAHRPGNQRTPPIGRVVPRASAQAPSSLPSLVADVAGSAISKLQRYVQPPPPGFPPGPAGDQSVALLAGPLECITRLRREHGPVVGLLLGGERVVLVAEPAAARQVLVEDADVFVKAGTAFFPGSSLTGNGLLVSDGDVWRRQRRLSNPAFRKAAVDRYADEMVAATRDLLDGPFAAAADSGGSSNGSSSSSAAGGVRDVYADFNQLTLNITLAALFGMRDPQSYANGTGGSSSSTAARIVAAVEKAFSYFAARGATAMVVPEWVPTPDNVAFREAVQQLDELVYGIIDKRQAENSQQPHQGGAGAAAAASRADLLQALLDARDDSGAPMARAALRDELMTLLVAGQETSAILLGWAAALLAHHPRLQAAAAAEVAAVIGAGSSSSESSAVAVPSAADVPRLPLVTGVVLEALRLFSPAYMVGRCANRDVALAGGYRLPAGTTVLVSPYLLHREPTRWREPAAFKPQRWLPLLAGQQQQAAQQQQGAAAEEGSGGCPMHAAAGTSSSSSSDTTDPATPADSSGCPMGSTSSGAAAAAAAATYSFAPLLRELGPNGAFVPFGGGPRNCIGTGFAMTEAVLVLALLLQRYELRPVSPAAGMPRPKAMLTLRPEAVPLRIVRRRRQQQQQ